MLARGARLGKYEIVASLGSGGMGDVYRALDPRLEREVAIKVIRSLASNAEAQARLWREARAALLDLMDAVSPTPIPRVPGVAIFLFSTPRVAPPALIANLRCNMVLHDRTYILSIRTQDIPRVAPEDRSQIIDLGSGVKQIILSYGFMDEPNARLGLTEGAVAELGIRPESATYFLGAESLNVTQNAGMARWREQLFTVMSRNTTRAARFFNLPSDRTVEVGIQVDL